MQGGAKSLSRTEDPWSCQVDSSKQNFFGAKPKQGMAASKSSWPNGMTSSSGKAQTGSSNGNNDAWGSTFKNRQNFVDMHLF